MLKLRVLPTLLYKDYGLVKGVSFDSWRRVGAAMQSVKVYNMRDVDELVFLDIRATLDGREPDYELIDELADECFMPMTVGGGIRTVDQVRKLLQVGADKVAVNSGALENPELVTQIATRFGSQCVVVSLDFRWNADGKPEVYTHSGTRGTGRHPVEVAQEMAARGAGELLLTSVDRDGTMTGYDLPVTADVAAAVSIPVIASGGAGSPEDMATVLKETRAAAVAAASIFHFTQLTPRECKEHLREAGFPVRQ